MHQNPANKLSNFTQQQGIFNDNSEGNDINHLKSNRTHNREDLNTLDLTMVPEIDQQTLDSEVDTQSKLSKILEISKEENSSIPTSSRINKP